MKIKKLVIWYHIALTVAIMFAGTFVWFFDPSAPTYNAPLSVKILMWFGYNALTTIALGAGPIVGFLASQVLRFGGSGIFIYILIDRLCAAFGEPEAEIPAFLWAYIAFSLFNTFTAYVYSDDKLRLFDFNFLKSNI